MAPTMGSANTGSVVLGCTLVDVARVARVGLGTASRALNGSPGVHPATAARVRRAAEELGYYPNRQAQNLRSRRSNVVGLVVPSLSNPIYEAYVRGVVREAARLGYSTFICDAEYDGELYQAHLRRLLEHRVDALVVGEPIVAPDLIAPFKAAGIPVDPEPADQRSELGTSVQIEDRRVVGEAYDDLLACGHRHVAFVRLARPGAPIERPRSDERVEFLREKIEARPGGRFEWWEVEGYDAIESFVSHALERKPAPTALVVSAPALQGTLIAMQRLSLKIPADVSLLVVGETAWARAFDPPLSTVGSDPYVRGVCGVRRVIGKLRDDEEMILANPAPTFSYARRQSIGPART